MSFQAMTWAVDQKLPAMKKIILLMMANRYDEIKGVCWPSHEILAEECGMDKRSVIRQIDKLTELGLIEPIRSKTNHNMNSVNQYRLNTHIIGELKLKRDKKKAAEYKRRGSDRESPSGEEANKTGGDRESPCSDRESLGSDRESLGVVTESHPILLVETINETVNKEYTDVRKTPAKVKQEKEAAEVKQVKAKITQDWVPGQRCLELISKAGIDINYALSLVEEFIFYWSEIGEKRNGWETTFLNHAKREWGKHAKPTQVNGFTHYPSKAEQRFNDNINAIGSVVFPTKPAELSHDSQ
jgi:DNA-binding Lrp family transcriptional regulator